MARPAATRGRWPSFSIRAAAVVGAAAVLPASAARVRATSQRTASVRYAGVAERVTDSNATAVGIVKEAEVAPVRVFFLFLAVDKVSNLPVWNMFFKAAQPDLYRAYVHCKLDSCKAQVQGSALQAVATVPSYYCTDLVSPMNQLLATALTSTGASSNPADKFAFISDSTLPAKPFAVLYSTLSQRQGSDFCVFPSSEWADISGPSGQLEVVAKTHQWITLERGHAQKLLTDWQQGKNHDLMSRFAMNLNPYTASNNTFADQRNWGCLDEFWHMADLYGPIPLDKSQEKDVALSLFLGGPLHVSASAGWQGECDTFVIWAKHLHAPGNNPFQKLYMSLDPKSVPHGGNFARPGWWDTISTVGLKAIRDSSFLFVRKFIDYPTLADGPSFHEAFDAQVLRA